MSRSETIHHGRRIVLAVIVASATLACATTIAAPRSGDRPAMTPGSAPTVARSAQESDVSGLIAKARAAQRQHDWRSLRRFQAALIEDLGLPTINAARMSYQRALANLDAATALGDSHARALFRAELRARCQPDGLVGAFEPCDANLAWGT
jgi:predicted metal-binding membrane protein